MAGLLHLQVIPIDLDVNSDELAAEVQLLRDELRELDLEEVASDQSAEVPVGAKGDPVAVGLLVLKLGLSQQLLRHLVALVRDWVGRGTARRVRLEVGGDSLEIDAVTQAELRPLIDAWVERHGRA